MSQYIKATNFTAKDSLPAGNASKVVKGAELDTEFTAIAAAISSKADSNSPTFTGTPLAPTASAGTSNTQIATTAFVAAERTATATLTNKTLTSPTINTPTINTPSIVGGSITGITDLAVADGGTGASSFTANSVLLGNGTSALQTVAPSTSGNILVSNGTTWTSAAAPAVDKLSTASGSAPSYSARAWVNFNGAGTVAIRASGNVDSITDNGTGLYTVNFATALPDANYAVVLTSGAPPAVNTGFYGAEVAGGSTAPTASAVQCFWWQGGQASPRSNIDSAYCFVAVFR